MNAISWFIAVTGALGFLGAVAGVVYVLVAPGSLIVSSDTTLHDTYYVIVHAKTSLLAFILCMIFSASVALLGYAHTKQYFRQMMTPGFQHTENQTKR